MFTRLRSWVSGLSWPIKIGVAALLLFLLWTGWGIARHWWHQTPPAPIKTVEEITAEKKLKSVAAELQTMQKLNKEYRAALDKIKSDLAADNAKREAQAAIPLDAAIKGGPDALATFVGGMVGPGESARLRAANPR